MVEKSRNPRPILARCTKLAGKKSVDESHMFSPLCRRQKSLRESDILQVPFADNVLSRKHDGNFYREFFISRRAGCHGTNLLALIERISWHWILREFRGFRLPRIAWNLYCWIIARGGALSWVSWSRDVESLPVTVSTCQWNCTISLLRMFNLLWDESSYWFIKDDHSISVVLSKRIRTNSCDDTRVWGTFRTDNSNSRIVYFSEYVWYIACLLIE